MTFDEKRRQYGEVLIERREAESELGHCEERIKTLRRCMAEAAQWLDSVQLYYRSTLNPREGPAPPASMEALDSYALIAAAAEAVAARAKLLEIQDRLNRMGLPSKR